MAQESPLLHIGALMSAQGVVLKGTIDYPVVFPPPVLPGTQSTIPAQMSGQEGQIHMS